MDRPCRLRRTSVMEGFLVEGEVRRALQEYEILGLDVPSHPHPRIQPDAAVHRLPPRRSAPAGVLPCPPLPRRAPGTLGSAFCPTIPPPPTATCPRVTPAISRGGHAH